MTEILSQDEIDALLTAISTGEDDDNPYSKWGTVHYLHKEKAKEMYEELRKEINKEKSLKKRRELFKNGFIHHVSKLLNEEARLKSRTDGYEEDWKAKNEVKDKVVALMKITLEQIESKL